MASVSHREAGTKKSLIPSLVAFSWAGNEGTIEVVFHVARGLVVRPLCDLSLSLLGVLSSGCIAGLKKVKRDE